MQRSFKGLRPIEWAGLFALVAFFTFLGVNYGPATLGLEKKKPTQSSAATKLAKQEKRIVRSLRRDCAEGKKIFWSGAKYPVEFYNKPSREVCHTAVRLFIKYSNCEKGYSLSSRDKNVTLGCIGKPSTAVSMIPDREESK